MKSKPQRKIDVMKVTFWGARGSIPSPGPNTVKYGGNTLCLALQLQDQDRLIVIDAGSGIRELGDQRPGPHQRKQQGPDEEGGPPYPWE